MFPPASAGPPPPDSRPVGGNDSVPAMPPSMIADQGQRARSQDKNSLDELSKKTVEMAVTKLMEVKNAMDGLNTAMKTIDPSADALMVPMIAAWQGAAQKVKEVIARASAGQPNMAGMGQPGAQAGSPAGQAGPAEGAAGSAEMGGGPPSAAGL